MPFNSKLYRNQLGFTNQGKLKKFFKFTDTQYINWEKIEGQNQRLKEIFSSINEAIHQSIKWENMDTINQEIDIAYNIIRQNNIICRLNNYGRYPEDVYYNWMRGYAVCKFFAPAISLLFGVAQEDIQTVGHDSLTNIETFSQSPVADLEINVNDNRIRLEIQSGYTGEKNDIKAHKVKEAKRIFEQEGVYTYVVHFDLFNGIVAIVNITDIDDNNTHWETRNEMEGQKVFAIPTEAFRWFIPDEVPNYFEILY
ncbi:MAG: restriction endonuclease [Clostridia bacterium]|nr:restriction endonuclease [Clostridia bacterium]